MKNKSTEIYITVREQLINDDLKEQCKCIRKTAYCKIYDETAWVLNRQVVDDMYRGFLINMRFVQ